MYVRASKRKAINSSCFLHLKLRVLGKMKMEVEKKFIGNIKPSSRTPDHLKIHKLSILDQTFGPFYVPLVLFYLNNQNTSIADVISNRLKHLRLSLSDTLTRFYTFAGRIKDDLYIDCNDEGVFYVEARINYCCLSDLLMQPNDQMLNRLIPENPIPEESSSGHYVLLIQVNIFDCGGIAISVCTSHKTIDANTYTTFMKAWAATARGSSEVIYPSFSAQTLFPQNPSLAYNWPPIYNEGKYITRRFVFDASALASLKTKVAATSSQVQNPTRVDVVSALMWKCAMEAASKARNDDHSKKTPSVLALTINLRRKKLPPLPQNSVGNYIWYAFPQCLRNSKLELNSLVACIRKALAKINSEFVEEIKGHEGFQKVSDSLKESGELLQSVGKGDCVYLTSMCNSGVYEADFGWGKPAWFFYSSPTFASLVMLADTRSGDGIEAFVTLPEQDMALFEKNPELLAFTSLDPSPLKLPVSSSRL